MAAEVHRLEKATLAPLLVVGDTFYELLDPPSERLDAEKGQGGSYRDTLKNFQLLPWYLENAMSSLVVQVGAR